MAKIDDYEVNLTPVREKLTSNLAISLMEDDIDPLFLELFLLYLEAMGYKITEPVECWLNTASNRCYELGYNECGQALANHANAESGHHKMREHDVHALISRLNSKSNMSLKVDDMFALPLGPGATTYVELHNKIVNGDKPYTQLALQYEIEMLPTKYGNKTIDICKHILGDGILDCMVFLKEHVVLDVGHTKFNRMHLTKLLETHVNDFDVFVDVGSKGLEAYGMFLNDCFAAAKEKYLLVKSV